MLALLGLVRSIGSVGGIRSIGGVIWCSGAVCRPTIRGSAKHRQRLPVRGWLGLVVDAGFAGAATC